jgi:hypothetical protein
MRARRGPRSASVKRRDGAGHLDPAYARGLREQSSAREPDEPAFVKGNHADDDLAEELAEEVVEKVTSGEDEGEDVANQEVSEDRGGPFVVTTGGTEFADGVDESNPADAQREPFPLSRRSSVVSPGFEDESRPPHASGGRRPVPHTRRTGPTCVSGDPREHFRWGCRDVGLGSYLFGPSVGIFFAILRKKGHVGTLTDQASVRSNGGPGASAGRHRAP